MTFQLADSKAGPANANIPSKPMGSTPTSVPGVDPEVYELQRESPQAVLVVFALHVVGSSSIGIGDQTSTQEELDA
ncbi:MAG: hypothetical protein M3Y91_02495, partial [Actinomycetota bacterium]|nr:hypothetical protein [Actinomycetota bacterium]